MSRDHAFAELERLASEDLIRFDGPGSPAMVGFAGFDPHRGRLQPGGLAGVIIRRGNTPATPKHLDPRNALALVRFCRFLAANFGVTELSALEMDGGGTHPDGIARIDCHGQGRAMDFAGVTMPVGDVSRRITVASHWGTVETAVTPGGSWPGGARVRYRLDEPDASPLGDPDGDLFVADFFRSVYDFAASEWQDHSDSPDPACAISTIGDPSFILHPDHPDTRSVDHIHFQIGKSGTE
ncbi:hypothetical protein ACQP0C_23815 [Nocardia sp. CA-129566]|uniref:hypothetical protein n=1 Tax=Nocardia sp. CA-129566 TaxID=3239976 RepID=UPI003D99AB23